MFVPRSLPVVDVSVSVSMVADELDSPFLFCCVGNPIDWFVSVILKSTYEPEQWSRVGVPRTHDIDVSTDVRELGAESDLDLTTAILRCSGFQ